MAGCNCNKETYKITYDDTTEKVKSQHSDWSPTQVRLEVAKIFRPQYRQNSESVKQELSGKELYESTPFTFDQTSGVRFKNGEGTMGLLEFHERQALLTPDKYSPEEHAISLLIDKSIRSGANEIVTSYPSPDGHRDIVVMTLDRDTGKGMMKIINTRVDRSALEIKSISKNVFSHLFENSSGNIFVLSDRPLSEKVVRQTIDTVRYAGKQTMQEVKRTFASVRGYIEERRELKAQEQKREQIVLLQEKNKKHMVFEALKEKIPQNQKIEKLVTTVETQLKQVKKKFLQERVFVRTEAFALEKKLKNTRMAHEMKKFIARHERKTHKIKKQKEIHNNLASTKELFVRAKKEGKSFIVRKNMLGTFVKERVALKKRIKQKETIAMILKPEKRKTEKVFKERIVRLLSVVRKLIRTKERIMARISKKREKLFVEKKLRLHERVINFSIAFIFWVLLRRQYVVSQNKHFHVSIDESKNVRHEDESESTLWILLAIIWHLVMRRESGMIGTNTPKKQKKSKKLISYPRFAPQGVIFAYAT